MKRKVILLILVMVLLLSQGVGLNAQEERKILGWMDGNKYLEMPEEARSYYVGGLFDMLCFSFSDPDISSEIYKIFEEKIEGSTMEQIREIFDKYLAEHPKELHHAAASTFISAMTESILFK